MSALTDRDTNAQRQHTDTTDAEKSQGYFGEENKPQTNSMHQQMLNHKLTSDDGKTGGPAYVSPSDAIMSPASQKLANFKQRQMNKSTGRKPAARTLFARTPSGCSNGLEDVEVTDGNN